MSAIAEEKRTTEFDNTMEALRRAERALPDFTSSYDGEIRRLYDEIVSRPAFRYDPQSDPLYQSYRTQMVTEGERAMRDTMGQAAALTGGYGSSYAQGVGQQEYGLYLQRLGQVMPQLYKAAWDRYSAEGDALKDRLGTALALAQDEVGRAKDRFGQTVQLQQLSFEHELANNQLQFKQAQASYAQAAAQEKQGLDQINKNYQKLSSLITQSGYVPTDAELAAAGMTRAQAQALRNSYLMKNPMAMALSGGLGESGFPGSLLEELQNSLLSGLPGGTGTGGYPNGSGGFNLPGGVMSGNSGSSTSGSSTSGGSASGGAVPGGTGTPGTKEQIKLAANQKGSGSKGKHRRE